MNDMDEKFSKETEIPKQNKTVTELLEMKA
jgi:hypothetical protein